MEMDINQKFNLRSGKFQEIYGYGALLEMYIIGIMNFLVDVGFVKQEDLSMIIMKEMDRFETSIRAQRESAAKSQINSDTPTSQFTTTAPKEEKQSFTDFIKKEKGESKDEKIAQT